MKRLPLALASLLLAACALHVAPGQLIPHTAPIPRLGVNLGPERYTPFYLQILAAFHQPLTLRTAVQTDAQAAGVLAAVQPYPDLSVLLLVEKPDLFLVESLLAEKNQPQLAAIELVNEPSLQGLSAAQFGDFVGTASRLLTAGGFAGEILSGGVYTVTPETRDYLLAAHLPPVVCVGWHLYGDSSDDTLALMQSVSPCIAITESGMPSRTPAEDLGQQSYLQEQKASAQRVGAKYWLIYQLVSGPSASNLDNFGLLRFDNTPKPGLAILAQP